MNGGKISNKNSLLMQTQLQILSAASKAPALVTSLLSGGSQKSESAMM